MNRGVIILKNDNINIKYAIKALIVVIVYLLILLGFSIIIGNEIGSVNEGFITVFYGFYFFVYTLMSIKDGFPISIKETTGDIFWMNLVSGVLIYFIFIYVSHYYLFSKIAIKKKMVTFFL